MSRELKLERFAKGMSWHRLNALWNKEITRFHFTAAGFFERVLSNALLFTYCQRFLTWCFKDLTSFWLLNFNAKYVAVVNRVLYENIYEKLYIWVNCGTWKHRVKFYPLHSSKLKYQIAKCGVFKHSRTVTSASLFKTFTRKTTDFQVCFDK